MKTLSEKHKFLPYSYCVCHLRRGAQSTDSHLEIHLFIHPSVHPTIRPMIYSWIIHPVNQPSIHPARPASVMQPASQPTYPFFQPVFLGHCNEKCNEHEKK